MRIVIALGGNALLARGDKPDAAIQLANLQTAAEAIAPLAAHHDVLICHGDGPQVGMLSLESETDHALTRPYPLDDLVAQTQGMIGYWLAQALRNAGVKKPVLGLITQTLVDAADPAFAAPTKFVGPVYRRDRAQLLAHRHSWTIAADNGRWRRVVASPEPLRIVEQDSITGLLDAGSVVICGGGGGAAVTEKFRRPVERCRRGRGQGLRRVVAGHRPRSPAFAGAHRRVRSHRALRHTEGHTTDDPGSR